MQLLTILILVALPIIFAQFISARLPLMSSDEPIASASSETSHEQVKRHPEDSAANKTVVAFQGDELFFLYDDIEGPEADVESTKLSLLDQELEPSISEPVSDKKVRLIKGKQNVQGMEFLSIVLMLKEKQK